MKEYETMPEVLERKHSAKRPDHDDDFYAWCFRQAELLRAEQLSDLDRQNLIDEIEDMGREQRNALGSSYRVLIVHLLKWQFQSEKRSRSWDVTIDRERTNIEVCETGNRTLRNMAGELVEENYPRAVRAASKETGLPRERFPNTCPYTLAQLRDPDFLPE